MLIQFHPCPRCSSRDNLAEYSDNYYCFGCGYYKPKHNLNRVRDLTASDALKQSGVCNGITLSKTLAIEAKKWLLGYGLSDEEMQQFSYDHENDVLYLYASDSYRVGRVFAKDTKTRYISKGRKPVLTYGKGDVCVLVEDILSALKVGRQYAAIPMLGAKPSDEVVKALYGYESIVLWGDADKMRENIVVRNKLSERLNKPVKLCFTSLDPREYSNLEINYYINNALK